MIDFLKDLYGFLKGLWAPLLLISLIFNSGHFLSSPEAKIQWWKEYIVVERNMDFWSNFYSITIFSWLAINLYCVGKVLSLTLKNEKENSFNSMSFLWFIVLIISAYFNFEYLLSSSLDRVNFWQNIVNSYTNRNDIFNSFYFLFPMIWSGVNFYCVAKELVKETDRELIN